MEGEGRPSRPAARPRAGRARLVLRRRPRRRARADHRPRLFRPDRWPGALALSARAQARWPPGVRLELRLHPPARQVGLALAPQALRLRSEEHTSELQSLMRISYAVFCLKKKNNILQKLH